ncbi:MAG: NAD(P)H-hydrate dehydratase [Blastocatellia bacterium]|nr:NAD(P)H-hydrate dehydratase [Blastocatellia bacterium]
MKILTADQMREMDRRTVEECGISYATLMETAGARVVEAIVDHFGEDFAREEQWSVFCGKGNNGGDGAVIARLLWMMGAPQVRVYLFGRLEEVAGEARANLESVRRLALGEAARGAAGGAIVFHEILTEEEANDLLDQCTGGVIDALLGTGVTRPAEGLYARVIEGINAWRAFSKIVSVDIPSGLAADQAAPIGPHVRPDLTVAFTAPKMANASCAEGALVVAPIGTPLEWIWSLDARNEIVEEVEVREFLRRSRRAPTAHKGSVGDMLLIAGARGKTGAAALAAESTLRAGVGLVTVATAASALPLLVTQTRNEAMTEPLAELAGGAISHAALERALQLAAGRTVLALGPGLSSGEEETRRFVREFVERRTAPLVIDADGLNALAPWPEELCGSESRPIIITPHPGEMARLTGRTSADVATNRVDVAREFAVRQQVVTILKGSGSVIAAPNGRVHINPTGNAGMATAGSGDVLTGLIAGLLAQRPHEPLNAALAGVFLHGVAGDLAAYALGLRSLLASDIIDRLSAAILQVGGDAERGNLRRRISNL